MECDTNGVFVRCLCCCEGSRRLTDSFCSPQWLQNVDVFKHFTIHLFIFCLFLGSLSFPRKVLPSSKCCKFHTLWQLFDIIIFIFPFYGCFFLLLLLLILSFIRLDNYFLKELGNTWISSTVLFVCVIINYSLCLLLSITTFHFPWASPPPIFSLCFLL